ncbi:MAG: hypothetical protein M1814_003867 [Vezdaea aestivalis]|nr:MAG: hypothetical protein M1814_003867 [Vezdaea aestivalis]
MSMIWLRRLTLIFVLLVPLATSQLRQVAIRGNNHPLRPYVYPIVIGGVRYFREYSRQQLRQRWSVLTRQQLNSLRKDLPGTSAWRRSRFTMATNQNWAADYSTSEKKMNELYGARALIYDDNPFHHIQAQDYMGYLKLIPGQKVLDLACGTGILALLAKAAVGLTGKVLGVDITETMLDRAKTKAKETNADIEFLRHDVTNLTGLNLPKDWDVIVCASAFIFLDDQPKTLKHWASFLKPGGRIVFDVPVESFNYLNFVVSDAASALGLDVFYDGRWIFGPDAVAIRLAGAGLEWKVLTSQTYSKLTYDLEEGLRMLNVLLNGPFGRTIVKSQKQLVDLSELAEINFRKMFAEKMDDNGLITQETKFYIGEGTKLD